jgi:hypothetical protein
MPKGELTGRARQTHLFAWSIGATWNWQVYFGAGGLCGAHCQTEVHTSPRPPEVSQSRSSVEDRNVTSAVSNTTGAAGVVHAFASFWERPQRGHLTYTAQGFLLCEPHGVFH